MAWPDRDHDDGGRVLGARWRRLAATLLVAGSVAACTAAPQDGATPTPDAATDGSPATGAGDPGYRIAIVLGPPSLVAAGESAVLDAAATTLLDDELAVDVVEGVTEVRVLRATTPAFAGDLLRYVADDGYDLVCLVGTGTGRLLGTVARERRATRFCGTDASVDAPPSNVAVVGLDPSSLLLAAAAAVGDAPSPVGLMAGVTLGDVEAIRATFAAALAPARAELPATPSPGAAPTPSPSASPGAADAAAAQGADGTSTAASAASSAAADRAAPTGAGTTATEPATPGPSPTEPSDVGAPGVAAEPPPVERVVVVATGPGALPVASAVEQLAASAPTVAVVLAPVGGGDAARAFGDAGSPVVTVSTWAVDEEGQLPGQLLVALTVDWAALLRAAVTAGRDPDAPPVATLGAADGVLGVLHGTAPGAGLAAQRVEGMLAEALAQ